METNQGKRREKMFSVIAILAIIALEYIFFRNIIGNDELRDRLIEFRKQRSNEMGVPAYYVFTNDELDKLIEVRPQSIEALKKSNILTPIKIKTHGELIINEINR